MKAVCLCLLVFVLSSCSGLQVATPPQLSAKNADPQELQRCKQTFVEGNWQFVHSITFEMANGHGATVIGVTVLDGEILKTGLMGVEGFVLFEAELDKEKKLDIRRALPPFDNTEFALGLVHDVQTIFLQPSGENPVTGQLSDGSSLCRYVAENGQIHDVVIELDGSSRINVYDVNAKRTRSVIMEGGRPVENEMIPEKIQLKAHGLRGYTLNMTLISADKI